MDFMKLKLQNHQERLIPFIRSASIDWDFIRGQLLELNTDDSLFLKIWCQKVIHLLEGSLLGIDYESKLLNLESNKESLNQQMDLLSKQINEQNIKIYNLEKILNEQKNILESKENILQNELIQRSSLETEKLKLLTDISNLHYKYVSLEKEHYKLIEFMGSELNDGMSYKSSCVPNTSVQRNYSKTPPPSKHHRIETTSFGTLPRRTQPSSSSNQFNITTNVNDTTNINHINNENDGSKNISISYQLQKSLHSNINNRQFINGAYYSGTNTIIGGMGLYYKAADNNKSISSPNLAGVEKDDWEQKPYKSSNIGTTNNGILKILTKLKRNNSTGLDNVSPENNFIRNSGLRSTTGLSRIGWMKNTIEKPTAPIQSWDSNNIILWLNYIGLEMYTIEIKRWVKTGQQLLDASIHELEKELGIKNPLHRKKLNLAIYYLKNNSEEDIGGELDYHWVIHWLDDIGLPQYKENFMEGRVDGRILNHMTTDDLFILKITNLLHHISIKRGIQLLRIYKFQPDCLCRRGGSNDEGIELRGPKFVSTWTHHRVMEWLKSIDLAEYASNLRGSGVHGSLIIFEPKFNSELLSTLLSIPNNKTLLRRHLCLKLNELVGKYIVQEKRVVELSSDFIPIHPTHKVKQTKSIKMFRSKVGKKLNEEHEELLCPMDWNMYPFQSSELDGGHVEDGNKNGVDKFSNI